MVNFLKYRWLYFLISAIVIASGWISIFTGGLKYSIEFTGGTDVAYTVDKPVDESKVETVLRKNNIEVVSQNTQNKDISLRTKPLDEKKEALLKRDLEKELGAKLTVLRSETVGPTLGKELVRKTMVASGIGILGILLYVAYAFRSFNFAVAAIGALVHDILVVVGVYSLVGRFFGAQVDTLFVTALLTTMSFSVHDTIVIFDKIREYRREEGLLDVEQSANKALMQTMVRSLNNSMTIVFMLLALTLFGGATIKFFIVALLIGTITGTYSSPFIATPLLLLLERRKK